ncbi:TetR/AcrR family transcriptional regulator [Leptospira wolffii]|uniref:TetR/AcrR family transcriptional regulator n=1 Tax=Leptospira wolffii TaxID=409998 RepID=UPI00034D2C4D|nr:TetR/AcrR family transcriptional regulator [Leptospira wolffii]TGK62705.1 TetR/AcrR family transcriptional regulator [Leptospira wolffii]TGK73908.1 TetR/AcrR family transcriptional regulator [Leptospira wolffii]TGK75063.1 TetR/AcrR family transcriptional regulator [Leptospira wolffii]TGL28770.1 TetR/AcrR family transcriptional regulator [Leptospira wolffii]
MAIAKRRKILLPKRERTRAQIMNAALRLFAIKDAGETSIAEVSAEAEVANGTFYNYFKTKEELLEASALALAESLVAEAVLLMPDITDGAERMALGGMLFLKKARNDMDWAWALIRVAAVAPRMSELLRAQPLKDMQKAIKAGRFSIDSEESALGLYVGALHYGIRNILEGRAKNKSHDVDMIALVLKAFGVSATTAKNISQRAFDRVWKIDPK